jgi:hypothetical protein
MEKLSELYDPDAIVSSGLHSHWEDLARDENATVRREASKYIAFYLCRALKCS